MKFTKDDLKKYGIYAGISASLLCAAYVAGSIFSSANSVARQEAKANFENFIIKFAQNLGVSKVYFETIEL